MDKARRRAVVAGNWKMNILPSEVNRYAERLKALMVSDACVDVIVCVPFVSLSRAADTFQDSGILVGAQNLNENSDGAFTGEVSAGQIADLGVQYVIVGHSERRALYGESEATVGLKVLAALEKSLTPIVCVGETLSQREAGLTLAVVSSQLCAALSGVSDDAVKELIIAYEPVWAIGTGKTASSTDAQEVCAAIRNEITKLYTEDTAQSISILYGGSVNEKTAEELFSMPDIDGGLVGGASLDPTSFARIVDKARSEAGLNGFKPPAVLVIMDGYGLAPPSADNAISNAHTPVLDRLFASCPRTVLSASGTDVGLPAGQIGNSEVGHMNIGAGRVVYQDLSLISHEIETGVFFDNKAINAAMSACAEQKTALHLMGLLSHGGVHSHTNHLWALLELAKRKGLERVYIHCFMDGRDVPPSSGKSSVEECLEKCRELNIGKIATVMGRYYAMDRDNRWERVEPAYNAMVFSEGIVDADPLHAVLSSYENGVTDEFIKPVVCDPDGKIKSGDSVIFFNFRPDRAREITRALVDPSFTAFERRAGFFPLHFVCMTRYDESMPNVTLAYPPKIPSKTVGEIISGLGRTQLRIAETEKYAHVTFFFNGGNENVFDGEDRVLIPSPQTVPTYDLIPEMSAYEVAKTAAVRILSGKYDIIILNLANCDMVGHTGSFDAAVKAVEAVDECVGIITDAVEKAGGFAIVTADHGNAEQMCCDDGASPNTAHTTNLVPFIISGADVTLIPGKLCDIAPTMFELMGISKPSEMTGVSLIVNSDLN